MRMTVNQVISRVSTQNVQPSNRVGASKQFAQECITRLGYPWNVSDHNGTPNHTVEQVSSLHHTKDGDVDLREEEIDQSIEETRNVERISRIKTSGNGDTSDERVSDRDCHHNVDEGHNGGTSILQDMVAPELSRCAKLLLCGCCPTFERLTLTVDSNQRFESTNIISIASLKHLEIRLGDHGTTDATQSFFAKDGEGNRLKELREDLVLRHDAERARFGRANAYIRGEDSAGKEVVSPGSKLLANLRVPLTRNYKDVLGS